MDLDEAIEKLNELKEKANIENMDMNDCFYGEHIEATETVLQELENSIPKKKIEDKIKKLESKIPKDINCANDYDLDNEINYKIAVLQELLEDK